MTPAGTPAGIATQRISTGSVPELPPSRRNGTARRQVHLDRTTHDELGRAAAARLRVVPGGPR